VGPALSYPRERVVWSDEGDPMKSVMVARTGKQRCRGLRWCLSTFALGLYSCALLLAGCATRQPGETAAEVGRRHDRVLRLNTEMMMADIDRFLLLDRPSILTDKRVP
jgi:hypothetical protein